MVHEVLSRNRDLKLLHHFILCYMRASQLYACLPCALRNCGHPYSAFINNVACCLCRCLVCAQQQMLKSRYVSITVECLIRSPNVTGSFTGMSSDQSELRLKIVSFG